MTALLLIVALLGGAWLWTPDADRALLEAQYAQPPSRFVQVAGVRLHVRETGPAGAPAVLMLHGFGSSLHTWEPWALALSEQYRVVRIDLPAAGLTGADPTGDYSDARSVQLLGALLDTLGLAKATVVGHSMGGRLAWRFAAEQPHRVHKLLLVAPDGFASPGFEYGKAPEVTAMVKLMQYVLPKAVLRLSLEPAYADPQVMTDELVTRYWDLMRAPGVRAALIQRMQQLVLQDPVPLLRRITAPTLLLWGAKDTMIPAAHALDYQAAMAGAEVLVLPGLGHLPHEEGPVVSLAPVRTFLGR